LLECRYRRLPFRVGPTETRSEIELPMPKKASGEDGVKAKQRSKSDKAKRTFELNGTYSAKHMRLKADRDSAKKAAEPRPPTRSQSFGENSLKAALPDVKPKGVKKRGGKAKKS
jgi:hypothetical protein